MSKTKIRLRFIRGLLGAGLILSSTLGYAEEKDFGIGLSAHIALPDESAIENHQAYALRLGNTSGLLQGSLELMAQHGAHHDYQFAVPYNNYTEHRLYNIYSASLFLYLAPVNNRYVSIRLGGFGGMGWLTDVSDDAEYFDKEVFKNEIYYAGPVAELDFFPQSRLSIFVEARKLFHLKGTVARPVVESVDLGGNVVKDTETIKLSALMLGAGFRFNF